MFFGSKSSKGLMIKMCGAHNSLTFQVVEKTQVFFFSNLQIFRKSPTWKSYILGTWCFLSVDMELWGPFCLLIKAVFCSLFFGVRGGNKKLCGVHSLKVFRLSQRETSTIHNMPQSASNMARIPVLFQHTIDNRDYP